jgi:hypothetical protein
LQILKQDKKAFLMEKSRKIGLTLLMFVLASLTVDGKNPSIVGTWTLDSISIVRIERDSTETVVKYNDAKDIVFSIFDTIVFDNSRCRLKIAGRETLSANYTLTDTLFTVVGNKDLPFQYNRDLSYRYKLDKSLTLKNIFFTKGHTVTQYNVEMRFIKH